MNKVTGKLTVFFENPFWVGVFERIDGNELSVSKVTFGAEPKDCEVYDFVRKHYYDLRYSPAVAVEVKESKKNPKRLQREAKKQLQNVGIGTKSQQALKMQHEQSKMHCKEESRRNKEEKARRLFEMKQEKKREKHKGH